VSSSVPAMSAAMSGPEDGLSQLEDARTLVGVLLYLDVHDLCRFCSVDSHRQSFELADNAWCQLCEICWRNKSARYRLTPERARLLATTFPGAMWRDHYRRAVLEGHREQLKAEELQDLKWAFNFTPQAGGRGTATKQFVEFAPSDPGSAKGFLMMKGYPPLPYELKNSGTVLDIANFPPHYVKRLPTWEWEITNENVTFVSCVDNDVQYSDRGFLDVTVDDILEQTGDVLSRTDAEAFLQAGGALPPHIILISMLHNAMRSHRAREQDAGQEEEAEQEAEE